MKYKAVIFDFDGTIADSIEDIAISANHILKKYGYDTYPVSTYRDFVGNGIVKLWQRILAGEKDNKELLEKLMCEYREHYIYNNTPNTKPYEGISELLVELKKKGVLLCVLSNKPHEETKKMTESIFCDIFFEIRGHIEPCPVKPDPTALNEVIKKTGFAKENILYVGDSDTDMKTAKNAGLTAVGCTWGLGSIDALFNNGADYLAKTPTDILELFHE